MWRCGVMTAACRNKLGRAVCMAGHEHERKGQDMAARKAGSWLAFCIYFGIGIGIGIGFGLAIYIGISNGTAIDMATKLAHRKRQKVMPCCCPN